MAGHRPSKRDAVVATSGMRPCCEEAEREPDNWSSEPKLRQLQKIAPEQLSSELMRRLPLEFLKKQRAIPILLDKDEPAVALADPLNLQAYDAIVRHPGPAVPADRLSGAGDRAGHQPLLLPQSSEEENYFTPDAPDATEPDRTDTGDAGRLQHGPDAGGRPAQHRRQGAGDQAGQQDPVPRGPQPGQRYPHRAVRRAR